MGGKVRVSLLNKHLIIPFIKNLISINHNLMCLGLISLLRTVNYFKKFLRTKQKILNKQQNKTMLVTI